MESLWPFCTRYTRSEWPVFNHKFDFQFQQQKAFFLDKLASLILLRRNHFTPTNTHHKNVIYGQIDSTETFASLRSSSHASPPSILEDRLLALATTSLPAFPEVGVAAEMDSRGKQLLDGRLSASNLASSFRWKSSERMRIRDAMGKHALESYRLLVRLESDEKSGGVFRASI